MRHAKQILAVVFILCTSLFAYSQKITTSDSSRVKNQDSVLVSKHSPTAAILWSIIPGGGQIYNKKYWKVPIIYGLLDVTGYFLAKYASDMMLYRQEFINRRDGHYDLLVPGLADLPDENILALKQSAQRNMELCIAGALIIYTLNFIDAMVDAHLYYFDVSDDLSLHWSPSVIPSPVKASPSYGITLALSFK